MEWIIEVKSSSLEQRIVQTLLTLLSVVLVALIANFTSRYLIEKHAERLLISILVAGNLHWKINSKMILLNLPKDMAVQIFVPYAQSQSSMPSNAPTHRYIVQIRSYRSTLSPSASSLSI